MATFILTWNPDIWPDGVEWLDECAGTASPSTPVAGDWSVGGRKNGIVPGDTALLLRQRRDRGIVASGRFTTGSYRTDHWDGSGRMANNADVDFDCIVPIDERLPVEHLKLAVPSTNWDRLQGSGVRVPDDVEATLLDLWREHTADSTERPIYPDEESPTYPEGTLRSVKVNRYERNRRAREACLRHYGPACAICGFDFEAVYGVGGGRGVHVHHLRELSEIGRGYQVDPIKDLIPVCPNCHAAVHSTRPALTPDDVKAKLRRPSR